MMSCVDGRRCGPPDDVGNLGGLVNEGSLLCFSSNERAIISFSGKSIFFKTNILD